MILILLLVQAEDQRKGTDPFVVPISLLDTRSDVTIVTPDENGDTFQIGKKTRKRRTMSDSGLFSRVLPKRKMKRSLVYRNERRTVSEKLPEECNAVMFVRVSDSFWLFMEKEDVVRYIETSHGSAFKEGLRGPTGNENGSRKKRR
jgi:hypothetical protein